MNPDDSMKLTRKIVEHLEKHPSLWEKEEDNTSGASEYLQYLKKKSKS